MIYWTQVVNDDDYFSLSDEGLSESLQENWKGNNFIHYDSVLSNVA